jgi:hypothetical protein
MRLRLVSIAALVAAFGVFGCASLGDAVSDPALMFHETQREYTNLMRFTDFAKAAHYVAPDARSDFHQQTTALGDLHFTDYEVRDMHDVGKTTTVEVAYVGYRASDPVVVTYVETQEWERDGGVWLVRPHIAAPAR